MYLACTFGANYTDRWGRMICLMLCTRAVSSFNSINLKGEHLHIIGKDISQMFLVCTFGANYTDCRGRMICAAKLTYLHIKRVNTKNVSNVPCVYFWCQLHRSFGSDDMCRKTGLAKNSVWSLDRSITKHRAFQTGLFTCYVSIKLQTTFQFFYVRSILYAILHAM